MDMAVNTKSSAHDYCSKPSYPTTAPNEAHKEKLAARLLAIASFFVRFCLATLLFSSPAKAEETENPVADSVDTERIFGFTEGADIGEKGERELENTVIGRFGKLGSYAGISNETNFEDVVADRLRATIGVLSDYHAVSGVTGLADRHGLSFSGLSSDLRWQILERVSSPVGLSLSFAPQWQRIDDLSGQRLQSYTLPFTLLVDTALVPNKLFAAFNLSYASVIANDGGVWRETNPISASLAITTALAENVFLGAEIRYAALDQPRFLTGPGLFVGPSLYIKLSEKLSIKAAWSAQIPAAATGRLDLTNYERNQGLAQFEINF
jgi:hypothetical protein